MKHIVQLTLSNPSHEHVSLRGRINQQNFIAEGRDESEAINRATRHFRTLGFKVHSAVIVEQKVELPEPTKAEPVALSEAVDYKALEKPTIARIKSGETKPVDRTDYNKPAYLRKKPVDKKAALEAYIARRKETVVVTEEAAPQYIEEKLSAADPASKWIHDFVKSDNPKFAGKSKEERIRMALGAKYAAQRNEEVEQVDEASNADLRKTAAYKNAMAKIKQGRLAREYGKKDDDQGMNPSADIKMPQKSQHIKRTSNDKFADVYREEVEQVAEGFDTDPHDIAAYLVSRHGKGKVTMDHIEAYERARDSHRPIEKHEVMKHVKKLSEEAEQTDEATKMSRIEWRTGTPAVVAKNHEKIYNKLLATDPKKAKKFLDSVTKKDSVKEAADPGETRVVNKAVKTKKAAVAADKLVKIAKSKVNKVNMDPKLDHDVKQSSRY
jgi:hypothetical protein